MNTWIKICGVTNMEDARIAVDLGANALGFVMHKKSPRCCDPKLARNIIQTVSTSVMCVGVWLDESADVIGTEAGLIGCHAVQNYHLRISLEIAAGGLKCIPAIVPYDHFVTGNDFDVLWDQFGRLKIDRFILDKSQRDIALRNTQSLPLKWKENFNQSVRRGIQPVLAGGLNESNVYQVLSQYRPGGVDVASGIESTPGRKDHEKLRRFFEEVRRWDMMASSALTAADSSRKR